MILLSTASVDRPTVLPDVLAIHTVEMIPKSMILCWCAWFTAQWR